jgi:hypothetical protein
MATLSVKNPTLLDWAKTRDPDGKTAVIVEMLSQDNEILMDMPFIEGNLPTGHQFTQRTGLPDTYYRKINQGVPSSKSTSTQITENAAILNARSEVDCDLAELEDDVSAYRLSEAEAFVESMSQTMAETVIYGSAANAEEFVGLANRYNDLSAENAQNILDAGGTGSDNTSIWLCGWSDKTVCGVFPKGSMAGLSHEDLGKDDAFDADGNRFRAYMDDWKWKNGLVLKDWRYVVRVPNIDVSDLIAQNNTQDPTAPTAIIKLMTRAMARLPKNGGVRKAFYANRTVLSMLMVAAQDKSQNTLSVDQATGQFGEEIYTLRFMGIPVRLVDRILDTEAQVS